MVPSLTLVDSQSNICHSCLLETGTCIDLECLEHGPDLGVASLIASCEDDGIRTHLIRGSTRYLRDVLVTDSDELVGILTQNAMPAQNCRSRRNELLRRMVSEYGEGWFRSHLRDVFETLSSRQMADSLSMARLKYSKTVVDCILSLYGSSIIQNGGSDLSIVKRLYEAIERSHPDVVGFSIKARLGVISDPLFTAVSPLVRERLEVPVIVGGQFTSGQPLERLQSALTLSMRDMDYLVRGNADLSLPMLVHEIEKGEVPKAVPNVSYREGDRIVGNPADVIRNLDALPIPDFSQFDLDAYAPVRILPMLTARGCPWRRCAFCSHYKGYGDDYVALSTERVVETLEEYRERYGAHHVIFNDETLPSARARDISLAILKEGIDDIYIDTYGRMEDGYSKDLLELMSKSGFRVVFWGVESGCQRVLDSMDKGIRIQTMERVLKDSHDAGIANFCFLMFGFPGEERSEAMETYNFLNRNRDHVDVIVSNLFTLSSASPIGRDPEKWGVVWDDSKYGYHVRKGMQPAEVAQLADELGTKATTMVSDRFSEWWQSGVLPDSYWRNLLFVFHSMGLIDVDSARNGLSRGDLWGDIYPIFTGRIIDRGRNGTVASAFWKDVPSSVLALNAVERLACSLSDGSRSLAEMLESCRRIDSSKAEEALAELLRCALALLIDHHLVVFFSRKSCPSRVRENAPMLLRRYLRRISSM